MQEPLNGGSLGNRRCSKCEQSLFLLLNGINFVQLRVSRNLVGIIFYTRKVLLTSHYEKRLFEYASQPRVAGSDIRLLSYLWS